MDAARYRQSASITRDGDRDARPLSSRSENTQNKLSRIEKLKKKMVRTKDGGGIKSNTIISEVQKRPCLYDTNHPQYGDRAEKARAWETVCHAVVPGWSMLGLEHQFEAGKEVQKRWRSIRDSFTKAYRQGKCLHPEQCAPGSRRYQYHRQMYFLLRALQTKRPRLSQDKYESFSEVSNSPQHNTEDFVPKIKNEGTDKPLDLKTKVDPTKRDKTQQTETKDKVDKTQQTAEKTENLSEDKTKENTNKMKNPSLEIKIDANSILPDDHFDDDKLFMSSLIPLFKKMDDDTRLLCRIEVLKIIRYALQGNIGFEALRIAEDNFFKNGVSGILTKEENDIRCNESTLSMTTRSADGSRPVRKRKMRSPSPLPIAPKRRGPGRPRKVRPPPSDSDDEETNHSRPTLKAMSSEPRLSELDQALSQATSVAQLNTPVFMKMYNLERSKNAPQLPTFSSTPALEVSIKSEPIEIKEPV